MVALNKVMCDRNLCRIGGVYPSVSLCIPLYPSCIRVQRDTEGYRGKHRDTVGYRGIQRDTEGYRGIQVDTGGYRGIQVDTGGYRGIQGDTGDTGEYRGIQRHKEGYRGIFVHTLECNGNTCSHVNFCLHFFFFCVSF